MTGTTQRPVTTARKDLSDRLAMYREVREGIEREILPRATSVDGVTFTFQASLHHLELRRAGYAVLEADGHAYLGQVTDLRMETAEVHEDTGGPGVHARLAVGSGLVVDGDGRPFHDAVIRPASAPTVQDWLTKVSSKRAGLTVGELLHAPGVLATLDSGGPGPHNVMWR